MGDDFIQNQHLVRIVENRLGQCCHCLPARTGQTERTDIRLSLGQYGLNQAPGSVHWITLGSVKDIQERFSIDKTGWIYRVEVYCKEKFSGMVLVDFNKKQDKLLALEPDTMSPIRLAKLQKKNSGQARPPSAFSGPGR